MQSKYSWISKSIQIKRIIFTFDTSFHFRFPLFKTYSIFFCKKKCWFVKHFLFGFGILFLSIRPFHWMSFEKHIHLFILNISLNFYFLPNGFFFLSIYHLLKSNVNNIFNGKNSCFFACLNKKEDKEIMWINTKINRPSNIRTQFEKKKKKWGNLIPETNKI